MTFPTPVVALFVLLLQSVPPPASEPSIVVERKEPTVERILFDPKKPPADMPRLHPGEAALCQMNFNCAVQLKYEVIEQTTAPAAGGANANASVSAQIRQIRMTLTLHNKIYLPRGASPKLRAHEEGHRIINERVYEKAEEVARSAAIQVLTQTFRGSGADPDAAGKAATDQAVKQLCESYLAGTADKAHQIGLIYDELTNHGRNTRLSEADAIRQSFARYNAEGRDVEGK